MHKLSSLAFVRFISFPRGGMPDFPRGGMPDRLLCNFFSQFKTIIKKNKVLKKKNLTKFQKKKKKKKMDFDLDMTLTLTFYFEII